MARDWIELHGRILRRRDKQRRHNCAKRKHGRPCTGYGNCYPDGAPIRKVRKLVKQQLRQGKEVAHLHCRLVHW